MQAYSGLHGIQKLIIMNKSVIILAAGDISSKLHYLNFNCGSPALIPLNTRPLATYIIDFYLQQKDTDIILVISEEFTDVVSSELMYYKDRISILPVSKTRNVNDSLNAAIAAVSLNETVIVNVVTTIPVYFPAKNNVLVGNSDDILINCSYINTSTNPVRFFHKTEKQKPSGSKPFQGVFCVDRQSLIEAAQANSTDTDLLSIVKHIYSRTALDFIETDWIDCGHEANYYEARQSLISCRGFNNIRIDSSGILQKKSSNNKKLIDEINFIENLPENLKVFFPRIFEKPSEENNFSSCKMEYYAYPSVSELFLYWDISDSSWRKLFKKLDLVLEIFSGYHCEISHTAFLDFYQNKVIERISRFASQSSYNRKLTEETIVVNGFRCLPIKELAEKYSKTLDKVYDRNSFAVMHGDFCFNNILFDYSSGLIKLIDARGSFGNGHAGIFGDPLYDIAKLAHSALGGYDYFVNNLYQIAKHNNGFTISFLKRKCAPIVEYLCNDLIEKKGYDKTIVDLIVSTLFLSMPPLHSDNEDRQTAMYLHGLYLFNTSLAKL